MLFFPDFQAMKPVSGVPTGFLPLNRATVVATAFKERVLKSPYFLAEYSAADEIVTETFVWIDPPAGISGK